MMKRLVLVAALLSATAGADEREAFHAASALIGVDDARAAQAFERLATEHPDDEYADDALMEAAELNEEKLARPDHAAELYKRLLDRYPSSRLTLRARARWDFLRENLRTGAAPLAEYQEILLKYATRSPAESMARMERLLVEHPDFALADDARLWLGRTALREGRTDEAVRWFAEVERRAPGTPAAREAKKGRADAALAAGHAREALALYRALGAAGDRASVEAARAGERAAVRAMAAFALFVAALAYLGLFLAACGAQARRQLLHAPFELKFYLPVALLFVAAAATENRAIGWATAAIAAGGALVVWFGGAATVARLARGPLSRPRRLARAAATATAVLAVSYATVHATRLTDLVVETLRNGPEK